MAIDPFEGPVQRPLTGRNSEAMHAGSEHVRSGQATGQRLSRMARKIGDVLSPDGGATRRNNEAKTQATYGKGGLIDRAMASGRHPEDQARQERSNALNQAGYARDAGKYVNDMLKNPGDSIFNAPEPDIGRLDPNRRPDKFV